MKIFNRWRGATDTKDEQDAAPAPPVPVRVFPGTVPLPQLGGGAGLQESRDVDEHQGATAGTPALHGVVERLAGLGGRAGRRAALRLLERQGSLELAEAQRVDRAAESQARADARRERVARLAPTVVYVLAVGAGAGGQVSVVGDHVGLDWPALFNVLDPVAFLGSVLALLGGLGVAGLIEGAGLAFATAATRARVAGRHGTAARAATWVCALAASGINAWGHWGSVWAYPTALGSLVALALWEFETYDRCAEVLASTRETHRREAAVRRLAYESLRVRQGKRVARLAVTTMTAQQLAELVAETVRPEEITRTAVAAYVHDRERNPQGPAWRSLARLLARESNRAKDKRAKDKRGRAPKDARTLTDGSLPEGPVSPAPSGAARASAQQISAHQDARAPRQMARAHTATAHHDSARSSSQGERAPEVAVPDEAREWIAQELRARDARGADALTGADVGARFDRHPATGRRWLSAVRESLGWIHPTRRDSRDEQ
ncbi:MAG: hypothetical protein ACRDT6_16800 [Micromonosporaceae bacterium]